jgi:hypothetical protein
LALPRKVYMGDCPPVKNTTLYVEGSTSSMSSGGAPRGPATS